MPLTKGQKTDLYVDYKSKLSGAYAAVVLKQDKIPVNEIVKIRNEVRKAGAQLQVVKKTLFFDVVKELGYSGGAIDEAVGSAMVVYIPNEDLSVLKLFVKLAKVWKKEEKPFEITFSGGYVNKEWQNSSEMTQTASLPSRQELLGSLAFMFQYPLTQAVVVLDKIREQKSQ